MTSFKSANQLLREGKLDDAVAAYREAIAVNPGFSHAHNNLGEALVKAGRVDEAVAAFRRAVELNPQAVWSLFKLGELLRGQERFEEAVGFLRGAVELKSDVAEFNLGLGAALVRLGSALEEAEACLRRAVELNPFLAEAFYFLGVAASGRGQWSEAVEFYGRGLEVNPSGVECGLGLAEALGKLGRWSEAVERYGQIELASGESGEVCFGLGQALGQLGRWEEGVVEYRRAVALGFAGAEVRHHLGYALGQLGRWEEGVVEYRLVVEVNPKSATVRHQLGYGLMRLGRWGEAAVELRRSVELYPGSAVVWQQLGDVLRELGEDEEAIASYTKALEVEPQLKEARSQLNLLREHKANLSQSAKDDKLFNLGRKKAEDGLWSEAVDFYRRAIELNPSRGDLHHHLGYALQRLEKWEEAIASYTQALKLVPNSNLIHQQLGDIFAALKRWDRAIAAYQKAIQLKQDSILLFTELGDALLKHNYQEGAVGFYRMALQGKADSSYDRWLALGKLLEKGVKLENLLSSNLLSKTISEKDLTFQNFSVGYQKQSTPSAEGVRLIAYYLPQFHPIPENDLWWGQGFTEWANVTKAKPLFDGHYQPHLPADLGFYDLRLPEAREAQAELAKKYGIYGFCYYYYWFGGKRLLHRPIDEVLRSKKPDFPFCICWANENWTRRWDGAEHEILIAQDHSLEGCTAFAKSIIPFLLDERYIRVNGAPLLIVYRTDIWKDEPRRILEAWRKVFKRNGVGEVHLCVAITCFPGFPWNTEDLDSMGFDSAVMFPPHGVVCPEVAPSKLNGLVENFSGNLYDYKQGAINYVSAEMLKPRVFQGAMTSWDNTARRKLNPSAFIYSSPDNYEFWLRGAIEKTKRRYLGEERLIFINAWNEWAEGAHLEPDREYGHAYLRATRNALYGVHNWKTSIMLLKYLPNKTNVDKQRLLKELEVKIEAQNRTLDWIKSIKPRTAIVEKILHKNTSQISFNIESLQLKEEVNLSLLSIAGWVYSEKNNIVKKINVISKEKVIDNIAVNTVRQDVNDKFSLSLQTKTGFLQYLNIEENDSILELDLVALLDNELKIPMCSISLNCGTGIVIPPKSNPWYTVVEPIIVNLLKLIITQEKSKISDREISVLTAQLESLISEKEEEIKKICKILEDRKSSIVVEYK